MNDLLDALNAYITSRDNAIVQNYGPRCDEAYDRLVIDRDRFLSQVVDHHMHLVGALSLSIALVDSVH